MYIFLLLLYRIEYLAAPVDMLTDRSAYLLLIIK